MDSLSQTGKVLGIAAGYLVANLFVALLWSAALSSFRRGWVVSLLLAPGPAAAVSYWLKGQPYYVLFYCVWAFALGAVVVFVVPKHATKRGKFDRRYKHNPDVSGITDGQREAAIAGFVSVVAIIVTAWLQGWPGYTLK